MSTFRHDIGFAVRTLRKSPAFAFTAIATIALGIGASTTIFSVVNTVLLRPLPYNQQDRLAFIQNDLTSRNLPDMPMPPGDLPDLRRGATLFENIAAVVTGRQIFTDSEGQAQTVDVANVTANFFATLGASVALGRDFTEEDGTPAPVPPQFAPGAPPLSPAQVAAIQASLPPPPHVMTILSDGLWRREFGADPAVIGKTFSLGGFATAEVVGVLQPGVELLWPAGSSVLKNPEMYIASRQNYSTAPRNSLQLRPFGRLKPGATFAQAQAQIDGVVAALRKQFPNKEAAGVKLRVEPMHAYLIAGVKPAIIALMGAVLFVLLIACANVANLLLVRASQRERELAVRAALGGSRWSLVRQMLTESLVLSGIGAALGLALTWAGTRLLVSMGPENLPRLDHVAIDPFVVSFAILAAMASAVIFGVVPALRASRVDVADILRTAGRNSGLAGGTWLRNSVVTAEVALAFVLLVGAGLMIRSFAVLQRAQTGYDPSGVLTTFVAGQGRPGFAARSALMSDIEQRLEAIPGVTAVTAASPLPLVAQSVNMPYGTEAAVADPTLFQQADMRVILPDYFEAMKTALIDGRFFNAADNDTGSRRIIVDDVLAKKMFPGKSAVGQRLYLRTSNVPPGWFDIIGVVQHQRHTSLAADGREALYLPDGFYGFAVANRWVIRTNGDPMAVVPAVRETFKSIDPSMALADIESMQTLVERAQAPTRFAMFCISIFAIVAGALASVGLYGVLSTTVRQRTSEIGVRMAFGAHAGSIFGMLIKQGAVLAGIGIVVGVGAALALTRIMRTMVVGVGTTDPATYVSIAVLFLGVSLLACWLPARRAAKLDPLVALRDE